jgi:hypothetical protein
MPTRYNFKQIFFEIETKSSKSPGGQILSIYQTVAGV